MEGKKMGIEREYCRVGEELKIEKEQEGFQC